MKSERVARVGLRGASAAFAAALLVLTAFASSAHAQDGPKSKLFVLPTQSVNKSTSSIIPERIGEQVRQNIGQDGRVVLMPTYEEIRKRLGGAGHASAAIAEAEQLYTSGIGLLTAGEDAKAAESFQRSVDLMQQNIGDIASFDILSDALANLSLAYFNAGFDLDARKRMKEFAHLRPDATLDPEKFDKKLIAIFKDEQKKIKRGGAGRLKITANIDGAKVFIDGVEKGATPTTVEDVGFGHHYLVVKAPSGSVWAEKIRVRGRKKVQNFKAELGAGASAVAEKKDPNALPTFYVELQKSLATGRFGQELQPYFKELTTQTGAQFVGWTLMYKDSGSYQAAPFMYRASDGAILRGKETAFNVELSNLRVGVSDVAKNVVDLVVSPADDAVVTDVEVGPAPKAIVAKTPTTSTTSTTSTTAAATTKSPYAGTPMQPPPEVAPSEGTSTWTYVAAGGAVLVAGALVAGGIYLLTDDDNPDRANGFDAVVSW